MRNADAALLFAIRQATEDNNPLLSDPDTLDKGDIFRLLVLGETLTYPDGAVVCAEDAWIKTVKVETPLDDHKMTPSTQPTA